MTVRALVAVAAATVLAVPVAGVLAVPAGADPNDGLRFEATVTYEVQPEQERVLVTADISVTNELPDRGTMYYYFTEVGIPVLAEAANTSARRVGGGVLQTSMASTGQPQWSMLTVRLSPALLYPETQRLQVSYVLPNLPPRSDGWTRVSPAYASFPIFPVGDPGLASVRVVVPDDYGKVEIGGGPMETSRSEDEVVYTASEIADPEAWVAVLAARTDDLLEERTVSDGGRTVVLRSWPGDDEWAGFVEGLVRDGIPVLEELIGRAWPVEGELEIIESATPHALGYGGWYDTRTDEIEVGAQLDAQTVLHELSHAWFNEDLGPEGWLIEGLAELYAYRTLDRLQGDAPEPEQVSPDDADAQPLAEWVQSAREPTAEDRYAYQASWWVLDRVMDEVGGDAMSAALEAGFASEIPYQGDPEPERVTGVVDRRRMLDLLQEVAGSAAAVELYTDYVLPADERDLLAERAEARSAYGDLVAAGAGWTPPLELRESMTYWEFDEVGALIDEAEEALESRDAVLDAVDRLGAEVDALPALEVRYEAADDVGAVAAEAAEYRAVAASMSGVRDTPDGLPGALAEVGLFGTDVDGRLDTAAAALAAGELDEARAASDRLARDVEQAPVIGAVVLGEVLFGAGLWWPLRNLRKRRGSAAIGSEPCPTDAPSSSLSTT